MYISDKDLESFKILYEKHYGERKNDSSVVIENEQNNEQYKQKALQLLHFIKIILYS